MVANVRTSLTVKEVLSLPTEKQQKMVIKIFGSEEDERVCDVVKIGMATIGGTALELPFFSVLLICEALSH